MFLHPRNCFLTTAGKVHGPLSGLLFLLRDRTGPSVLMPPERLSCLVANGKDWGLGPIFLTLVTPWHTRKGLGTAPLLSCLQVQLNWVPTNRVSSGTLPRQGAVPALLCAAVGMGLGQGQFSLMLLPLGDSANFSTFMTLESALLPITGVKE